MSNCECLDPAKWGHDENCQQGEIERLREKDANWKREYMEQESLLLSAQADNERLERELAEARRDANRYRWLQLQGSETWEYLVGLPEDDQDAYIDAFLKDKE